MGDESLEDAIAPSNTLEKIGDNKLLHPIIAIALGATAKPFVLKILFIQVKNGKS
ncbi:hypothetical protein HC931_18335 [Candidatus Gracilibacteria bacterium]|nr:hypothetical protein [Candidatus Gracilibacteria bacterium]